MKLRPGLSFEEEDGIAVFPVESEHAREQAAHFDHVDDEFETERPRGTTPLYAWLIEEKFRRSIQGIADVVPGCTALAVCAGSGMDAELLARAGAHVVSADISLGALPDGGFGLAAQLEVSLPMLDRETAEALVARAHQVCPYSNATRGNIDVALSVA
jgi:hypothetical protein